MGWQGPRDLGKTCAGRSIGFRLSLTRDGQGPVGALRSCVLRALTASVIRLLADLRSSCTSLVR